MAHTLSMDLRSQLLAAVDSGLSCPAAAASFSVDPSMAIRWQAQRRETGDFAPKPQGGDMRSRQLEERAADTLPVDDRSPPLGLMPPRSRGHGIRSIPPFSFAFQSYAREAHSR